MMPALPPPAPVDQAPAIVQVVGGYCYSFGGTYGDTGKALTESAKTIREGAMRRATVQVANDDEVGYNPGPPLRSFKVQKVQYRYLGRGEPPAYDFSEYDDLDPDD